MVSSNATLHFHQSITTKLTLLLLVFGLLPLGAVSLIVWDMGKKLEQKVGKKFEIVAVNIADKIDRNLFERYGDVQTFGLNSDILRRVHWYDPSEDNIIQIMMNKVVKQYGIYALTILVDRAGNVIAVNNHDRDGQHINTQFIFKQNYAQASWFQDLEAQVFTTTQPFAAPGNNRLTGTVVEDMHIDQDVKKAYPDTDGLVLGFSAPVYEEGKVVAYWTNRTNFSLVEDIVAQSYQELKASKYSGAEITLLDGMGILLMDYDPTRDMTEKVQHNFDLALLQFNLAEKNVKIAQEAVAGLTGYIEAIHARKHISQMGGYTHLKGSQGFSGMNWAVLVRVPSSEATAEGDAILNHVWLAALLVMVFLIPLGIFVGRRATGRIKLLEMVAEEMANGNFSSRILVVNKDELGNLGNAVNTLGEKSQEVVAQAHAIAEGNFSIDVSCRGEQDTLGQALQAMLTSLREVGDMAQLVSEGNFSKRINQKSEYDFLGKAMNEMVEHFQQLAIQVDTVAEGDYTVEIVPRSEEDVLGEALSQMVKQIGERTETNKRETWLKAGVSQLSECTQGESNIQVISSRLLSQLVKLLKAGNGVLYVKEIASHGNENTTKIAFHLMAAYAYQTRKNIHTRIEIGEGLVGQCAFEKEMILLATLPLDYVPIQSGLGAQVPNQVIVMPVLYEGEVVGVIELATFEEFTDLQRELLAKAASNFGITLNSVFSWQKTEILLEESQALTLNLQVQEEELRATNEELQVKAQELQSSEEELRQQSDALHVSNVELQGKSQSLEVQNTEIERKNQEIELAKLDLEMKAQDLAQASKYKSEFLANMSHELRTPLNSLLILAKALTDNEEGNLTDEQIESARVIHSGGKDLLRLINDILDLSKVEAGKLTVNIERVSLDDVCSRIHSLAAPLATEKGNTWAIDRMQGLPSVLTTDQQRLEQILKNLLSNAFKFTSQGSVSLRIHRMEESRKLHHVKLQADSTIVFSVVDTGMGIPADKQAAIFEAFQQADGSTSRTYGGTGLGLTITRELASMLGGEIQLVSEAGKGSTFSLLLPCEYVEIGMAPVSVSQSSMAQPIVNVLENTQSSESRSQYQQMRAKVNLSPSDTLGNNRLLIIEDDPVFGKILQQYGAKQGYVCSWAQTGQEGLRLALTVRPSAILMDMTLPDLSGDTILESLKHNPATQHIPVHVISGRDNLEVTLTKGAVGYLTKPVDGDVLRETIRNISQSQGKALPHVLLVEDDPIVQQATRKMIDQQGGALLEVVDTVQGAMDYLRDSPCDLLITDLQLPDRSGLELLQELSKQEEGALPPAIIYTAKDLTREEHQELLNYAACVVMKGGMAPERLLDEVDGLFQSLQTPASTPLASTQSASHEVEPLPDPSFLKGHTVLVVDDDIRNVFALSKVLKQSGASVVIADMGALALEKLEAEPKVDLVLLDIMMPEMDGYETTRRIRQHPVYSEVPIVILSAKTMPDEEAKCLEVGANGYLSKPLDLHLLHRMMKQYLPHPIEQPV